MNGKASFGAVILIAVSLTITGCFYLLNAGAHNTMQVLEAQVKIKLILDNDTDEHRLASTVKQMQEVKSVTVETKQEVLERLRGVFRDRENLFMMLEDGRIPDMLLIETADPQTTEQLVPKLKEISGVADVIYPQAFASSVIVWSKLLKLYGTVILIAVGAVSVISVWMAINLALFQRHKEINIRLLLGAKVMHLQFQFIVEGGILGAIASLISSMIVYSVYRVMLSKIEAAFPSLIYFSSVNVITAMGIVALMGVVIGVAGSMLSVRKLMTYA